MILRKFKLSIRSAFSFGCIAAIIVLMGLFALVNIERMNQQAQTVSQRWFPNVVGLSDLIKVQLRSRVMMTRLVVIDDPAQLAADMAVLKDLLVQAEQLQQALQARLRSDTERQLFSDYQIASDAFSQEQRKVMELVENGQIPSAIVTLNGVLNQYANRVAVVTGSLMKHNMEGYANAASATDHARDKAVMGVIAALVVAALATVVLATLYTRSIVGPLSDAAHTARAVAAGDLTRPIEVSGNDELTILQESLRTMQESLRQAVSQIAASSSQLTASAQALNTVTEAGEHGLQIQNAAIEQAATAVNEMSAAVNEVSMNANSTAEASRESSKAVRDGQAQVLKTVESIKYLDGDLTGTAARVDELAIGVQNVTQILDVIRAIAEQTNLLALNAAIEAARAGEAGRGFAVVADEVRALAHRTQQSTREIEQVVGGIGDVSAQAVAAMRLSAHRARETLDIARAAGGALDQITQGIEAINERNLVIVSAAEQQAQVVREVDRNLVNIRDFSVQTAAGASQTNRSSQELMHLADVLSTSLGRFQI